MSSVASGSYLGRTQEQINNAYVYPPIRGFQYGVFNSGTNVPASGTGVTITYTFPTPFTSTPFLLVTYATNATAITSMINYTVLSVTTTDFSLRVYGVSTGGAVPMVFNWVAWPK